MFVSSTNLIAVAPAGSAGPVHVTVTTAAETSATGPADQFTYRPVPAVTGVSPAAGPLAGGGTITLTGSGFTGATAVDFDADGTDSPATFAVDGDNEITARVPAGSAGTADIVVTTVGGVSATGAADQYAYVVAPGVTAISPASGYLGETLTITGTGFTGATSVTIGGTSVPFTVAGDTRITATLSLAVVAGDLLVQVTNPGGTSGAGAAADFSYAPPTVSGISESSGNAGDVITITGQGLSAATGVSFGGVAATSFTVVSDTEISTTVPAGTAGTTVDVTVAGPAGTSAAVAGDRFSYALPPVTTTTPPATPTTPPATTTTPPPPTTPPPATTTPPPAPTDVPVLGPAPAAPASAPPPVNRFTFALLGRSARRGTVTLDLRLPGAGRITVLETAWNSLLTHPARGRAHRVPKRARDRGTGLLPGADRFTFATGSATAVKGGALKLTVKPGATGKLAAASNPQRYRINVWLVYTPRGGSSSKQARLRLTLSS